MFLNDKNNNKKTRNEEKRHENGDIPVTTRLHKNIVNNNELVVGNIADITNETLITRRQVKLTKSNEEINESPDIEVIGNQQCIFNINSLNSIVIDDSDDESIECDTEINNKFEILNINNPNKSIKFINVNEDILVKQNIDEIIIVRPHSGRNIVLPRNRVNKLLNNVIDYNVILNLDKNAIKFNTELDSYYWIQHNKREAILRRVYKIQSDTPLDEIAIETELNSINYTPTTTINNLDINKLTIAMDNNITYAFDISDNNIDHIKQSTKLPPALANFTQVQAISEQEAQTNTQYVECNEYSPITDFTLGDCDVRSKITNVEDLISDNIGKMLEKDVFTIVSKPILLSDVLTIDETLSINNLNQSNTDENIIDLKTHPLKWWIKAPIMLDNETKIVIKLLADTGANHPVINTAFAVKHFAQYICKNPDKSVLKTPNGIIHPKFCVYLLFPAKNGITYKIKFYLVDELPCDILADLNMLCKFGYKFSGTQFPPIFQHNEEPDQDLGIRENTDKITLHIPKPVPKPLSAINNLTETPIFNNNLNITSNNTTTIPLFKDYVRIKRDKYLLSDDININYCDDEVGIADTIFVPDEHLGLNMLNYVNSDQPLQPWQIENYLAQHRQRQINLTNFNHDLKNGEINLSNKKEFTTNKRQQMLNFIDENSLETVLNVDNMNDDDIDFYLRNRQFAPDFSEFQYHLDSQNTYAAIYDEYKQQQQPTNSQYGPIRKVEKRIERTVSFANANKNTNNSILLGNAKHAKIARKFSNNFSNLRFNPYRKTNMKIGNGWQINKQHNINFIMMQQSFKATEKEKELAKKLDGNKKLEENDITYLKLYPKLLGKRFTGTYDKMDKMRKQYQRVFATHTYSRRTMKVKPMRLGIMDKFRRITCYRAQYPLSHLKRLWMIDYSTHNDANGNWFTVNQTLHCIPYTMIAKRDKNGNIIRYRPAIDGRIVNQYCELLPIHMPTMKDFDDFFSIPGLMTFGDSKNFYNCIPMDRRDWPYATFMTPLGLKRMKHLAYGFKNCPFNGQSIMNHFAMSLGYTLIYIDDIVMKHPWHWTVNQMLQHVERLLQLADETNLLLNPTKFYPLVMECDSFGFKRTIFGSQISEKYKNKVLEMKQPNTVPEMRTFLGVVGYIARYIYNGAMVYHWLYKMIQGLDDHARLRWTRESKIAYQQLTYLIRNSPILHNPTPDGKFMIKCDASRDAVGAVLYQWQHGEWVIIDMHSELNPEGIRNAHSMVHEARAIVIACQYWQFLLLKGHFIMYSDNQPVVRLFTGDYRELSEITQRQLLRLRVALSNFTYEIKHVKGVDNALADALSRLTVKLVPNFKDVEIKDTDFIDYITAIKNDKKEKFKLTDEDRRKMEQYNLNMKNNPDLNIIELQQLFNEKYINIDTIQSEIRKNYNLLLTNHQKHAKTHEHTNIWNICESAKTHEILLSNEDSFEDVNKLIFEETMKNTINELWDIPESVLDSFEEEQHYHSNYVQLNNFDLLQFSDGEDVGSDVEYHPTDELDDYDDDGDLINQNKQTKKNQQLAKRINARVKKKKQQQKRVLAKRQKTKQKTPEIEPTPETTPMQTRSQSKQKRLKQKLHYRTDYVEPAFDNIHNRSKTTTDIKNQIFGHRINSQIFDKNYFKQKQLNNSILLLVISVMKRLKLHNIDATTIKLSNNYENESNEFKSIIKDLTVIENEDPYLSLAICHNKLKINQDGILCKSVWFEDQQVWSYVVPRTLVKQMMEYAHHNYSIQHLNETHTYAKLDGYYWWSTMKKDIKVHCDRCIVCKYGKGSVRHRAPMQVRPFCLPRECVFADFIEILGRRYHILVLIDYCTGWTMLLPYNSNDATTVVDGIFQKWIPLHGQFKTFDCDMGAGFSSKVTQLLLESLDTDYQYAEANHHRGIGKVERTIRFVQNTLQKFNLQLNEQLVGNDHSKAWKIIKILLPHVQAAINQRRPRFTTFSPNMLMFGWQNKDCSNINIALSRLEEIYRNKQNKTTFDDYSYLKNIFQRLIWMYKQFKDDWIKYVYLSKEQYDTKYNITSNTIKRNRAQFIEGNKVLYFIGDKHVRHGKWKRKFTGPWTIVKVLNDSTVIIQDDELGSQLRASIDRIKLFNKNEIESYQETFDNDEFIEYQNLLKDMLYGTTNVSTQSTGRSTLDFGRVRRLAFQPAVNLRRRRSNGLQRRRREKSPRQQNNNYN